jgi:hypothetical protein
MAMRATRSPTVFDSCANTNDSVLDKKAKRLQMLAHGVVFCRGTSSSTFQNGKGGGRFEDKICIKNVYRKGAEWNTYLLVPTNSRIVVSMSRSQYEVKRATSRELRHTAMSKFRSQDQDIKFDEQHDLLKMLVWVLS